MGFLSSGKTTLLKHILKNRDSLKVAVIVNDMNAINIDANLINNDNNNLSRTEEKLVEMTNGCICCTLREDLLNQVRELAYENRFDYLLIESTAISEPLPVASTFKCRDEDGVSLSDISLLDTMVTVVDSANLIKNYRSTDFIKDRVEGLDDNDNRTLVDLLVEQIEFANVILLNKIDLVSKDELKTVEVIIRGLNAKAKIIKTKHSKIDLREVLDSKLFNFQEEKEHPLWAQELYNLKDHVPETEEYGIKSFVYNARQPFEPAKIYNFFNEEWSGAFRSKGFFWIASRPDYVGEVSQAGAVVRHQGIGRWWKSVPKERWPTELHFRNIINNKYWDEEYGDRRQEIVFIGLIDRMDEQNIRQKLDSCLVKDFLKSEHLY